VLCGVLIAGVCATQTAQTPSSLAAGRSTTALEEYNDLAYGVRFLYPASWLVNKGGGAYIPTVALQNSEDASQPYKPEGYVALVGRDAPDGAAYRKTNFINGWFLYRVAMGLSPEQCYRKADLGNDPSLSPEWKAGWTTIDAVRFRHGSGKDAGLCNQSEQDVYAAVRGDQCYVFETQINTVCEQHGDNGLRDITQKELKEIHEAFDAVVRSVRIRVP
jgi:hypothetical protein